MVDRYRVYGCDSFDMSREDDGEWVKFEEYEALREANRELEKDRERLDWVEINGCHVTHEGPRDTSVSMFDDLWKVDRGTVYQNLGDPEKTTATELVNTEVGLREAIDAAMAEGGKGDEDS